MFQENNKFKAQNREAHTMDACVDPYGAEEFEAHVAEDTSTGESCVAVLDSAITYTILQDKQFFNIDNLSTWCESRFRHPGLMVFFFEFSMF